MLIQVTDWKSSYISRNSINVMFTLLEGSESGSERLIVIPKTRFNQITKEHDLNYPIDIEVLTGKK